MVKDFNTECARIVVIGAGVCGLSSAVCIQERFPSAQVEIVADRFSPDTTSDGSGGFWYPFLAGKDTDPAFMKKVSKETFEFLNDLAYSADAKEAGTQVLSGYFMFRKELEKEDDIVKDIAFGYRRLTQKELARFPHAKDGVFVTSVQVEVTTFLKWLMKRFLQKGGKVTKGKVEDLKELTSGYDAVVNCSGLGSRNLLDDKESKPIRGQVFRVHSPWVKNFYILDGEPGSQRTTYIIPGTNLVVVGGTSQLDDFNAQLSEEDSRIIWEDAVQLFPALARATPIKQWVGFRPFRPKLRVESETLVTGDKETQVIHNYGHGGSGVTLCWGCAKEVVHLLESSMSKGRGSQALKKARL